MAARSVRFLLLVLSAILIFASAIGWLSFMGFGIAYGDLVGVPGRERDLADLGRNAGRALAFGAICEAVAIGIASWTLVPLDARWARMSVAVALAVIADLLTLAVIKGI